MKTIYLKIAKWAMFLVASWTTGYLLTRLILDSYSYEFGGYGILLIPFLLFLIFWAGWIALSIYFYRQRKLKFPQENSQRVLHSIIFIVLHIIVLIIFASVGFWKIMLALPQTHYFGKPVKFTEDMWQPVAYKSDDFVDTGIAYDPNYDPEKDELLQFMNALQDKIYNSETHNYKEAGGALALGTGKEDLEWQTYPGQPKKTLEGRTFGMGGADSVEKQQANNYFKENGFTANKLNSTAGIAAYTKDKFA